MTIQAQRAYNGIVLLASYLQRLYVSETIYSHLNETHDANRIEEIKELFDDALAMVPLFEMTKELADTQINKLKQITRQMESYMSTYFKDSPSFHDKLALVGSSIYAEQNINNGIIRLSQLFNVEINQEYYNRIEFYEERTNLIEMIVSTLKNNEPLEEQFEKLIESWYLKVIQNKELIIKDMEKIGELIGF